jgi:hypothetical protein
MMEGVDFVVEVDSGGDNSLSLAGARLEVL